MNVLLWFGWACGLLVTVFTLLMFTLGAMAARSPSWPVAMRAAAAEELQRRGLYSRKWSLAEDRLIKEFLGPEPQSNNDETDEVLIKAIGALTDASEAQIQDLHELRERELACVQRRAQHAVAKIKHLGVMVKVWNLHSFVGNLNVALVGLKWFLPLFITRTRRIGEKYLSTATLIGVWIGLLYWGFGRFYGTTATTDWLTILGIVVTLSSVIGLVAAVGKQLYAVAHVRWGAPSQWTVKGAIFAAGVTITFATILVFIQTGTLERSAELVTSRISVKIDELSASAAVGQVLTLALLIYIIYRAIRMSRARQLRTVDRTSMGMQAAFWTCVATMLVTLWYAPGPLTTIATWACIVVMVCGGAGLALIYVIKWVDDHRALRRARVPIPRRGFRLWALFIWLFAATAVGTVPWMMQANLIVGVVSPLYAAVNQLLLATYSLVFLSFWPGIIVTILYVRRVTRLALELPISTLSEDADGMDGPPSASDYVNHSSATPS